MDNVAHTLIGISLGDLISRRSPELRRASITTAILGSNLADLDFLIPLAWPSGLGGKLDFLLHHRGHTHTLVAVLPIAFLSLLAGLGVQRRVRGAVRSKANGSGVLWVSAFLSAILHLGFDYVNDYGIHPFYPFSNRWIYGDFAFIVEPLLWLSLLPFVFLNTRRVWLKVIWGLLAIAILFLSWTRFGMPSGISVLVTVWGVAMFFVQSRVRSSAFALGAVAALLLCFYFPSRVVRKAVRAELHRQVPGEHIVQLAITPSPSDPFCWRIVTGAITKDDSYVIRWGGWSFVPNLISSNRCSISGPYGEIPGESGLREPSDKSVALIANEHFSMAGARAFRSAALRSAVGANCKLAALMTFARIPFLFETTDDLIAGDTRYDRFNGFGYSKLVLPRAMDAAPGQTCPAEVTWWEPPLQDVLRITRAAKAK